VSADERTISDPATSVGPAAGEARKLSRREVDVLRLVARGLTDQQIAAELTLSVHTIHRHIANARTRLGVRTRAAAAVWAVQHGLI
jgi:DNA-binding NarL/FixJ family response regulator